MPDRTWKRRERVAATQLGGRRIPVTGERAGADGESAIVALQCKHGRNRPSYLRDWLTGIVTAAQARQKIGVVVWSSHRERQEDAVVVMRWTDFVELHKRITGEETEHATTETGQ